MQNFTILDDLLRDSLGKIDRVDELKREIINSGLPYLHSVMGGMKRDQLILLGGRPAMGKTFFALNIALNVAISKKPVLYFYSDGQPDSIAHRILLLHSGISYKLLQSNTLPESGWRQLSKSLQVLSKIPLYINYKSWIDCSEICHLIAEASRTLDIGLVVIDGLQMIRGPVCGLKTKDIVGFIKYHLPQFCAPVVLISQVMRRVDLRKDPSDMTLNDVKDGRSIRDLVDKAIFIYRKDYYKGPSGKSEVPMNATVIDIHSGKKAKVPLIFNKYTGKIKEVL